MKLFFLLFTGLIVISPYYCKAQSANNDNIQFIDQLCYTESSINKIRVTGDVELTTLTTSDKIKFLTKEYVNNHVEYINLDGYAIHDIHSISHNNIYPEWYTKAYLIRKSNVGTFAFYTADNEYIPGGWVGATTTTTGNGTYSTDSRTRENYYHQDYTQRALELYERYNQTVSTKGVLYRHRWYLPSTEMYQQFESEGYSVTFESNILTITNPNRVMIWDDVKKIYIIQIKENEVVKKTTTYKYEYVVEFDIFLLAQTTISIPQLFDNGDCYTDVETISYTNYSSCNTNQLRTTGSNDVLNNATKRKSFVEMGYSISPNPVTDYLTIGFPIIDENYKIIVTDINGKILLQRKAKGDSNSFDINTSFFAKGMYVLKIQKGQDIYSTKFIKQ